MQGAFLSAPGNEFALLRMKGLIFGAVEPGMGWAVGSRALPTALSLIASPAHGAGTATPCIYFSCLISSSV